ncbi:MAG: hypothetical protein ACOYNZ_14035 [Rhodoferax sp.]
MREHGEVDTMQPCYFAVADGVSSEALPRTASRRLLEFLQTLLKEATGTASLSASLGQLQKDYVAIGASATLYGMASTLNAPSCRCKRRLQQAWHDFAGGAS